MSEKIGQITRKGLEMVERKRITHKGRGRKDTPHSITKFDCIIYLRKRRINQRPANGAEYVLF